MLLKLTFIGFITCLFFILAAGIPAYPKVHSSYYENECGPTKVWNKFEKKCTPRFIFSKDDKRSHREGYFFQEMY